MQLLKLIGQVLFVLGLAGAVFWFLPTDYYLIVGGLSALVAFGLMMAVEAEHQEITMGYLTSGIAIAISFGAFWPALPVIVVWGNVRRKFVSSTSTAPDASPKDKDEPSSRTGQ